MLLMRSRAEAQLAMLVSDANRLGSLDDEVKRAQALDKVGCRLGWHPRDEDATTTTTTAAATGGGQGGAADSALVRISCEYARGDARVRVGPLSLRPAVYALAGPNGCGKSTLLSVLTSCAREGALQPGISLHGSACTVDLADPSRRNVVEVHQRPYCPLYSAPIRWLADGLDGEHSVLARKAADAAVELRFISGMSEAAVARGGGGKRTGGGGGGSGSVGGVGGGGSGSVGGDGGTAPCSDGTAVGCDGSGADGGADGGAASLAEAFLAESDDYCGGLSGGQRAKLEVIRSVFLRPSCPKLLLLDEPFAALDATSKAALMRKLRDFCAGSVVIVVYHPEREQQEQGTHREICEAQKGFFDAVLEVKAGSLMAPVGCRANKW